MKNRGVGTLEKHHSGADPLVRGRRPRRPVGATPGFDGMGDSVRSGRADQGVRPTKTTGAAWSRTHNPSSLRGSRPVEHCIPRNRKTDKTADYRSCSAHHRGGDAPSNAGAELVLLASASCRSDRHAASRARRRADQGIAPALAAMPADPQDAGARDGLIAIRRLQRNGVIGGADKCSGPRLQILSDHLYGLAWA